MEWHFVFKEPELRHKENLYFSLWGEYHAHTSVLPTFLSASGSGFSSRNL